MRVELDDSVRYWSSLSLKQIDDFRSNPVWVQIEKMIRFEMDNFVLELDSVENDDRSFVGGKIYVANRMLKILDFFEEMKKQDMKENSDGSQ